MKQIEWGCPQKFLIGILVVSKLSYPCMTGVESQKFQLSLFTHSQQIGTIRKNIYIEKNIVQSDLNYAQIFYKYMM